MLAVFHPALAILLLAASADEPSAITSGGPGDLTMCSYRGCNLYHHIEVPARIAVGDTVQVHYGSNPKLHNFPVARIVRDGGGCTLYSQTAQTSDVDKIELASCAAAPAAQ